ncbi:MAG: hypothetical protein E7168_04330 [Firmicutes bacterium]|nr:hypothetical protein [Bacillota bacterium]
MKYNRVEAILRRRDEGLSLLIKYFSNVVFVDEKVTTDLEKIETFMNTVSRNLDDVKEEMDDLLFPLEHLGTMRVINYSDLKQEKILSPFQEKVLSILSSKKKSIDNMSDLIQAVTTKAKR